MLRKIWHGQTFHKVWNLHCFPSAAQTQDHVIIMLFTSCYSLNYAKKTNKTIKNNSNNMKNNNHRSWKKDTPSNIKPCLFESKKAWTQKPDAFRHTHKQNYTEELLCLTELFKKTAVSEGTRQKLCVCAHVFLFIWTLVEHLISRWPPKCFTMAATVLT